MNRRQRRAMMKKIPNGKKIIRQGIEKAMRALQQNTQCSVANDSTRGRRRQVGILQEDVSDEEKERIVDELVKCGNKSFFFDEFEDGVLQDSAQRQIAIPCGKVCGKIYETHEGK